MSETSEGLNNETVLSYLGKFTGHGALPATPQPHHLHPFTPVPSDAPVLLLKDLAEKVSVLNNALQMYNSMPITEHKLVSNLRQTSTLIHSLHVVSKLIDRCYAIFSYLEGCELIFSHSRNKRRVNVLIFSEIANKQEQHMGSPSH